MVVIPKIFSFTKRSRPWTDATYAVKEGGVIILVSECSEGIGSRPFEEFFNHGEVEDMNTQLHADFTMPGFVSLRTSSICRKTPVILISSLPEDLVKRVKMIPAQSPAEALQIACQIIGHEPETIYIMPHGGSTFPIVNS